MLRLTFSVFAALAVVVFSTAAGRTQGSVTTYDLNGPPPVAVGANLRIHKVMGEIGTFMLGEFAPGFKNSPHHHTHDQINVGIANTFDIVTTAKPYPVSRLRGLFVLPDVSHGNVVAAGAPTPLLIEFQPVRRTDFPPESEKVVFPRASAPTPPPAEGLEIDFRPESSTWQRLPSGARVSTRKGVAAAVSAFEIPASVKSPVAVGAQLPGAELYLYVLEGGVEARSGSDPYAASAGILLVNPPSAPPLQVSSTGAATSVLLVFEAARPR